MKIIKFYEQDNTISLKPDSFDDLYLLARIIAPGDGVEAESKRRFKPAENDAGEQKDIYVGINVEKTELDKTAVQLRLTGKIIGGKPERFIQIGSYHTINIGIGDELKIRKSIWKPYILKRLKEAVEESKKVTMGIIVLDDEKAVAAYIRGYGIDVITEFYSNLSKRMGEKEFKKQNEIYFNEVIKLIKEMSAELVVVAGPGFTKDNLKKFIEDNGIDVGKKLAYVHASTVERSGIREALLDPKVTSFLENERVKNEFRLLNAFVDGLSTGASKYGIGGVRSAIEEERGGTIIINDDEINSGGFQKVLDAADKAGIKIAIINAESEAGEQLKKFGGIAFIPKEIL